MLLAAYHMHHTLEHVKAVAAMESHLKGEREAPPAMDHQQCRFGQWLAAEGRARHAAQPAFLAIEPLHRQVHALAAELLALQASGQIPQALARLGELYDLRDALLAQLKGLFQESRPVVQA